MAWRCHAYPYILRESAAKYQKFDITELSIASRIFNGSLQQWRRPIGTGNDHRCSERLDNTVRLRMTRDQENGSNKTE